MTEKNFKSDDLGMTLAVMMFMFGISFGFMFWTNFNGFWIFSTIVTSIATLYLAIKSKIYEP